MNKRSRTAAIRSIRRRRRNATEAEVLELTFGTSGSFSAAESRMQSGSNQLIGPIMTYENGKTHLVYQSPLTGRKYIITHDALYGMGRPIGIGRLINATVDPHHRPAIFEENGLLYVSAEIEHNVQPLGIYASRAAGDDMILQQSATLIGTVPTYPMPSKKNGIYMNVTQMADIDVGVNKNTGATFDADDWNADSRIATRQANEDELYASFVNNHHLITDKGLVVMTGRNDDVSPAVHFRRYLMKFQPTLSGKVTLNWSESFSTTTTPTDAEMTTYLEYFDTGADTDQGYIPVSSLDRSSNIYDVGADGGVYKFIYILSGSSTVTTKTITLPGTPTLRDGASLTNGNNQMGACAALMPINTSLVYAFFRVTDTGFARIKVYKTVDLGDNWTEVQTLFSGIDADFESVIIPANNAAIENNKTFIICATTASAGAATLYYQKVAFGSLSTTTDAYSSVTAYTEAEYNALMARSYYIEAGKITNTGTTLNTIIDQGTQASNITTVGSPVLDNAVTPTFVTLDGVNDRLPLSITGLNDEVEATIFAVVKIPLGATNVNFLTASNSASDATFWGIGKSSTNMTRYSRNAPADIDVQGKEAVTDAYHIWAFTFKNGPNSSILQWYDGRLQLRDPQVETNIDNEGPVFTTPTTLTHISIGALVRTTTAFYGFQFKHLAISLDPLNSEQHRKAIKYLANKYGITITDHYQ